MNELRQQKQPPKMTKGDLHKLISYKKSKEDKALSNKASREELLKRWDETKDRASPTKPKKEETIDEVDEIVAM